MILEHQLRVVGLAAAIVGSGLVAMHAHSCASHGALVVTIPVPVMVAPPPPGATEAPPAPPTVTMPCADSTTELLVDDHLPVLCWGEHCLTYRDDTATTSPRPASHPDQPWAAAVVSADRVCTGGRCDPLGPKLRAAIAGVDPSELSATRDHAAIVTGSSEVWNRAADRPISLGTPSQDEGEVVSVDVVGDRLIVARSCNEYCSAIASIIDARGRRHGPQFAINPHWGREVTSLVQVDDDLFVAFGGFGEISVISHGRSVAGGDFLPESFNQPHEVTVHAVAIDHETVVAQWCFGSMCHLTRIYLGGTEPGSERSYITLSDDVPLPSCAQ